MSIASEITRLNTAKADIKEAIEGYGVTVPSTDKIDTYAEKIGQISGGEWLPSADTVLATFARRQSGGQGPATIEKIYGKSVVWAQMVHGSNTTLTNNSVTVTNTNDLLTLSGTCSLIDGAGTFTLGIRFYYKANHKYAVIPKITGIAYGEQSVYWRIGGGVGVVPNGGMIFTRPADDYQAVQVYVYGGVNVDGVTTRLVAIDLTDLYGAGNEPTSVDEFLSLFPDALTAAYDAGSMLPVKAEKIVTRGVNQWDEEWESGYIREDGTEIYSPLHIKSAHLIPILPATKYWFKKPARIVQRQAYYDANGDFLSIVDLYATSGSGGQFTTPSNAHYLKFYLSQNPYAGDVCINLFDPAINGQYFPYRSSDVGLPILKYFPNGLRGVDDSYDEIGPKKKVQRRAVVDLGSLTWTRNTSYQNVSYAANLPNALFPSSWSSVSQILCPLFNAGTPNEASGTTALTGVIALTPQSKVAVCPTEQYTSAADFKAAMSGVELDYPLAEPIETDIDEQMTYLPDEGGTEEISPITAPFTADIRYARLLNEE